MAKTNKWLSGFSFVSDGAVGIAMLTIVAGLCSMLYFMFLSGSSTVTPGIDAKQAVGVPVSAAVACLAMAALIPLSIVQSLRRAA